jgi:nicotinamide-nucleotide amidase
MESKIADLVESIAEKAARRGVMLCCAESCTGGWIAKVLTDRAGSSDWFDRGFVTYSNRAKQEMLGVSADTLKTYGAVSRDTVLAMAAGALKNSAARFSVAVSGIAGPGGGTPDKPVGTVWIAWGTPDGAEATLFSFEGDRDAVRAATVVAALQGLATRL